MKGQEDFGRAYTDKPFDFDWGEPNDSHRIGFPDDAEISYILIVKSTGDVVASHTNKDELKQVAEMCGIGKNNYRIYKAPHNVSADSLNYPNREF